jgi:hypothetical protein
MKPRPRSAEREAARHLTQFFTHFGFSPVERIPVLGRTGPDLTMNELGLVIDVKSRREVPQNVFPAAGYCRVLNRDLASIRLSDLAAAVAEDLPRVHVRPDLKTVQDYYDHMHTWTLANLPDGMTALVLHRPGMRFGSAAFVTTFSNLERIRNRCLIQQPS